MAPKAKVGPMKSGKAKGVKKDAPKTDPSVVREDRDSQLKARRAARLFKIDEDELHGEEIAEVGDLFDAMTNEYNNGAKRISGGKMLMLRAQFKKGGGSYVVKPKVPYAYFFLFAFSFIPL